MDGNGVIKYNIEWDDIVAYTCLNNGRFIDDYDSYNFLVQCKDDSGGSSASGFRYDVVDGTAATACKTGKNLFLFEVVTQISRKQKHLVSNTSDALNTETFPGS